MCVQRRITIIVVGEVYSCIHNIIMLLWHNIPSNTEIKLINLVCVP